MKRFSTVMIFIGALAFFVLCVGGGLLYMQHVSKQSARELAETQERLKVFTEKQNPPTAEVSPVRETSQGGHYHDDGTWHGKPHDASAAAAVSNRSTFTPLAFAEGVHPTSVSSNPLFKDGVPEHLQCPPELVGVYLNEDKDNIIRKAMPIAEEIKEKWNPNRPIADLWDTMVEADQWYRENADPEKAEMMVGGGRIDWLLQQYLDFPEIVILLAEDAPRASDMLRVERGLFSPDWNAVTLPDGSGRIFRRSYDKKFIFTWGESAETEDGGFTSHTFTYTAGPSNGDPNAEVIEVNLDDVTDEALERLGGWNFNINPYTTGAYKLGDEK